MILICDALTDHVDHPFLLKWTDALEQRGKFGIGYFENLWHSSPAERRMAELWRSSGGFRIIRPLGYQVSSLATLADSAVFRVRYISCDLDHGEWVDNALWMWTQDIDLPALGIERDLTGKEYPDDVDLHPCDNRFQQLRRIPEPKYRKSMYSCGSEYFVGDVMMSKNHRMGFSRINVSLAAVAMVCGIGTLLMGQMAQLGDCRTTISVQGITYSVSWSCPGACFHTPPEGGLPPIFGCLAQSGPHKWDVLPPGGGLLLEEIPRQPLLPYDPTLIAGSTEREFPAKGT